MKRMSPALLAAVALAAGLPAMATAQNAPQDQRDGRGGYNRPGGDRGGDRNGQWAGQRADDGDRGGYAPGNRDGGMDGRPEGGRFDGRPGGPPPQIGRGPDGRGFDGRDDRRGPDGRGFDGRDDRRGQDGRGFDGRFQGRGPDRGFDGRGYDGRGYDGHGRDGREFGRPGNFGGQQNWRGDARYDWRDYRDHNRDFFRGPRYQPPRGYGFGYRPFRPGYRIQPFFYGRQYWIENPWSYRLPPAYGAYRWIRYYQDVLLIDVRTGTVVDAIPDFFL